MRKLLLGLVCCLLVVGVANMGHASFLGLFGSGGKGGNGGGNGDNRARHSQGQGAHYDFGFMQHLQNLPEGPTRGGDGPVLGQIGNEPTYRGGNGEGGLVQTPVPEPATMVLMGMGLFGLAILGRNKFRK